ncbi:gamma-glutamyltranspeptidase 1-like isoform X2 [Gryllus bimaculatus]|nr:gamma-glutamyltranspeptidase 1-like isoform X2 [Gryllus bimaculatus]
MAHDYTLLGPGPVRRRSTLAGGGAEGAVYSHLGAARPPARYTMERRLLPLDASPSRLLCRPRLQRRYVFAIGLLLLAAAGLVVVQLVYHVSSAHAAPTPVRREPPDPHEPLPSSGSVEHHFGRAAVCSDGAPCSAVGRDILARNGSVVDAAVATLLCNGVVNCQSMGLGGGFLMTLYLHEQRKVITLNARERAPGRAHPEMFNGDRSKAQYAHKRYGVLPWKEVVMPAVEICEEGYNMTKHQSDFLNLYEDKIRKDPTLRSVFEHSSGRMLHMGEVVKHGKLCETLRLISERGGDDLYTGELAKMLVADMQEMGGVFTEDDLKSYSVQWKEPVSVTLKTGETVYSVPPPGSGALLTFMLGVLDGFNFTKSSVSSVNETILAYHRIVESFKFAFAQRTELGDPDFVNTTQLVLQLTSPEYATHIRNLIDDNSTWQDPKKYGAVSLNQDDHGTAHVSIIGPNGDGLAVTSTVNLYFGASIASKQTGIIMNSVMDDFSNKDFKNYFGLPWSPKNSLLPGKRPLSSMSPTIIIGQDGNIRMVVGASGGTKIPTAILYVIVRHLWFQESVKEAVDASRFHHQLYPMHISYEYGVLDPVLRGLEKIGHKVERYRNRGSIICAVAKQNNSVIANADFRKGGEVFGLD